MKITSFYYLEYPDCSPADPLMAASEVYVEIATAIGDINNFDTTYVFTVCTVDFLRAYLRTHSFYVSRSLIVVERFEDQAIRESLESILPNIDKVGVKK
jgi:hypothetical protein